MSTAELGMEGLTPEEIEALKIDDGDPAATQGELEAQAAAAATTEGAGDATENEGNDQDGADAGAAAAADVGAAAAATEPAKPAAAAGTDEPGPAPGTAQSAPILVATAPADADAKLAEIATKKADLRKQYDDGDITFDEYESQKDTLVEQQGEITRAVDRATLATEMEVQRQKNDWAKNCDSFLDAHDEYKGEANKERFEHFNSMLKAIAVMPQNVGLTGPQLLDKAHRLALADRGEAPPAAKADAKTAKAPIPKPALPPNLAGVPAAASNDPGEGKYASLDRLQTTNTGAYEEALAKMSEAERDAYLAT